MAEEGITLKMNAIVLAGGQGTRMGYGVAKPFLPFGGEILIERVLGFLRPRFRSVIVVTRSREGWGWLKERLVTDDYPQGGPLVGLARGLATSDTDWCFLVGCDMPFLQAAVVEEMARFANGVDAVALCTEVYHPLHAFYRRTCLPAVEELLASGMTSVQDLFRNARVYPVDPDALRSLDPDLISFRDVDTPDDYAEALHLNVTLPIQRNPS